MPQVLTEFQMAEAKTCHSNCIFHHVLSHLIREKVNLASNDGEYEGFVILINLFVNSVTLKT